VTRRARGCVQIPAFYKAYVQEVQAIIDANARLEFEALWSEHIRTGQHAAAVLLRWRRHV
jgi:hypothetical protein